VKQDMEQASQSVGVTKLLGHLSSALAEALSGMTGKVYSVTSSQGEAPALEEAIVWQQTFSVAEEPGVWLLAGRDLWSAAGSMVLSAVGIEDPGDDDCKSTWLEIAGQTMGGLAARVTGDIQQEVATVRGEEAPGAGEMPSAVLIVTCGEQTWLLRAAWSPDFVAVYESRAAVPAAPESEAGYSKTFDLLLDVALPVCVSFGKTLLQIREVLKLNTGSIVELNRLVSEPVEVIVNDCVIARGEVVVVEGNYGVRITHLASREDRIRTGMSVTVKAAGAGR
jgi:flagellar motor switch protein FliN/FliY